MLRSVRSEHSSEYIATRLLNAVMAGLFLIITAPLLLVMAAAIRWETPGPIFDRQLSLNRDGRTFQALSFRVTEYDRLRAGYRGNTTRIGSFLLYTRIVSLPQLVNVLRGDITLSEMGEVT
jgi:putative colanic acid biosysnthesis UDP-glucose lipid carrier transferase